MVRATRPFLFPPPKVSGWRSVSFTGCDPQDTRFSGIYAITGASADIPIKLGLQIGAGNIVTLDCSHTSSVSIGHVDGVTFMSDSGVFLSAAGPIGGVPEPVTWAMLFVGFAAVDTMARRRREMVSS